MNNIRTILGNSEEEIKRLPSESVDIICIDPPYLYLKNQKLDRPFDEQAFFSECERILTPNGFIILFGRGESFYRWNTILATLGLKFKEEIIWDKIHTTSPVLPLLRTHETISIFVKGKGKIRKVKVPYIEMRAHDLDAIVKDVKRLCVTFRNSQSMNAVLDLLENNKHRPAYSPLQSLQPIVRADLEGIKNSKITLSTIRGRNRCADVAQGMEYGMNEKSIIRVVRDHYTAIHPTQKPVRLLERLICLCLPKDKERVLVADFFAGSFSCAEACHNLGLDFIGVEIDEEYYKAGMQRLQKLQS